MDPFLPVEMDREAAKQKRIHFSVPSAVPTQLDPRQVEMIRRRRPTPATLFRLSDQPSSEDDCTAHQHEHGVPKAKRVSARVYQPPSLKAVQRMAQAHMLTLGSVDREEDSSEEEASVESKEIHPPTGTDSSKEAKCADSQSASSKGSEVNSMGRPVPFRSLRDQRGEEGAEKEEGADGRHVKGE